jgi:hypothetical protein
MDKQYRDQFSQIWRDSCRRVYVKETITNLIIDYWFWMTKYETSIERKEEPTNQVYIKEKIDAYMGKIRKLLKELYWRERLSVSGVGGTITRNDIHMARTFDFSRLISFSNNQCLCPFHNDTRPSMVYNVHRNKVRCYSCDKTWDTIQFVMDKEGLTFPKAVKRLI